MDNVGEFVRFQAALQHQNKSGSAENNYIEGKRS
jgi:hypothetical protein